VIARLPLLLVLPVVLAAGPSRAGEIVQEDTGIAFPETVAVADDGTTYALRATGVGLREATFLKINVYAAVSYVDASADLGKDPAEGLIACECARRIRMDFVRTVSAEDIVGAFRDGVKKNYGEEIGAFADDLETFLAYFDREVEEGQVIELTYLPGPGLATVVAGEGRPSIGSPALARALWAIWFGEKPVSGGLKRDLLSALR
jgi:hypothetical protein